MRDRGRIRWPARMASSSRTAARGWERRKSMDSILRLRRGRHIGRTVRPEAFAPLPGPIAWGAMADSTGSAPLSVVVAGYGLAGAKFHAPLVAATDGLELTAVVTRDPGRRAELAEDHPGVAAVDALSDALDDADVVVIASPNRFHVPLAREALAAGKHVVVDKPLAVTSAEARALATLAADAGVVLRASHTRRWDDDYLTLRRVVDAGEIGRVTRFESRFDRWRPQLK